MREGAGAGGGSGGETVCGIISLTRRTRAVKTALLLTTRRENRCVSLRAASAVFGLDARHEWVSARARKKKRKKFWRSTRPCSHAEESPQIIAGLSRLKTEVAGFGRPV